MAQNNFSVHFGARYLLSAMPNSNGMISTGLDTDKVAALYKAHKNAGQECLLLAYKAQKMTDLEVPQADVVDLGEKPIHKDETAVLLTNEDVQEYLKNAEIFKSVGLQNAYSQLWLSKPNLEKVFIPKK